jgi:hypothetical protein
MPCMSNQAPLRTGALRYVFSGGVVKRSLMIAVVVGALLSIANQWDVLLRDPIGVRVGVKVFLNFVIPFTVASVSAVLNRDSS